MEARTTFRPAIPDTSIRVRRDEIETRDVTTILCADRANISRPYHSFIGLSSQVVQAIRCVMRIE